MNYIDKINSLLDENNGVIRTSQVDKNNIPRQYLSILVKNGVIVNLERGIYSKPGILSDEMFNIQLKCSKGIFSHETALYLHDLTVPSGYNSSSFKNKPLQFRYIKENLHQMGITNMNTSFENIIKVYDIERTICDIVRNRNSIDTDIFTSALKKYASLKKKRIFLITKYAKKLGILRIVQNYMEVLI